MIVVSDTTPLISLLKIHRLDLGESEAIILSETIGAKLTLIDEMNARTVALQRGIDITGTIGILSRAFAQKLITANEIHECVEVLRSAGRYISERLIDSLLGEVD